MKILDNKKDYYDYLMGVYGIDEKIFYDRRNSKTYDHIKDSFGFPNDFTSMMVRVGNKVYYLKKDKETKKWEMPDEVHMWVAAKSWTGEHKYLPNPRRVEDIESIYKHNDDKALSKYPVTITLYSEDWWGRNYGTTYVNPILSSFPAVAKFIPAKDAWDEIYNFISASKDKPIVDCRTDKEHILSAGFDPKTSFRNM